MLVQVARRHVDGVADRRQLAVGARRAVVRPDDVVDLLLARAGGVEPALDDLDAVEVAAERVLQRRDEEGRRLARRARRGRSPPIGTPLRVAGDGRAARLRVRVGEVPAAEEAHQSCAGRWWRRSPCAAWRRRSPRACSRSPRRRHSREATCCQPGSVKAGSGASITTCSQRCGSGSAPECLPKKLSSSAVGQRGVAVGRADHAELVGVDAELRSRAAGRSSAPRGRIRTAASRASSPRCRSGCPCPRSRSRRTRRSATGYGMRLAVALDLGHLDRAAPSGCASRQARRSAARRRRSPP